MMCACGCGERTGRSTHHYRHGHKPPGLGKEWTPAAKARKARYYEASKEKCAAANKRYRETHREQYLATKLRNENIRRARKLGVEHEAIEPLVVLERDDGICGICGKDVDPMSFEMDHIIPLARGGSHTYANMQVAHMPCNRRKGAAPPLN